MHYLCIRAIPHAVAKKTFGASGSQCVLSELLTSTAREKEIGCPRAPARRHLAPVFGRELGALPILALWMLRSIAPKGGIPGEARRVASGRFSNYPFCYESHARVRAPATGGISTCPTARLQRKSAVCGLNGLLPRLRLGSLHLNPRPPKTFEALALLPFLRRGKRKCPSFRFGKKNQALVPIFPSKTESKGFLEERGGQGRTRAQPER
jgi:hypothetical protein